MSDDAPEPAPEPDPGQPAEVQPLFESCGNCGADLDVSELNPLDKVVCPHCGAVSMARLFLKSYRIESVVGYGGMGTVYKARDLNLNREVALKVINREYSSDPEHWKKFEEEAQITARVNHPNVVKVYSFGAERGVLFIAMELADKGNLDDLMMLQGRIAEAQALEVGIQIAEGLQAAFKCGLIHRDVKPGNILFTDAHTAKIVDFGLACLVEEAAEARGEVWGTPYYVAPEKLNMEPEDFRSDIYSLGATLFHAIAGRPPHEAETASMVALKHIKSKAVSLQAFAPDVSAPTAFVVNRMLKQHPDERYQSYTDLVEHLNYARNKLLEHIDKPFRPHHQHVAVETEDEQSVIAWFVLFILVLAVGVGVALFFFKDTIFKKEESGAVTRSTPAGTAAARNINAEYAAGRQLLCSGDYNKAGKLFSELSALPGQPQPLGRWILLHQGMASLLARRDVEARQAFKRLQEKGLFSLDTSDKVLSGFFVEAGRLLSGTAAIPPEAAKAYNPLDCEALGYLLYALHDWQMSDFDDAGSLLQSFVNSNPGPPFEWIAEYKPVARRYVRDYNAYWKISKAIEKAEDLPTRIAALQELQTMKSPPMMPGKLPEKLARMLADLQQQVDSEKEQQEKKQASEQAALRDKESRAFTAAKAKYSQLVEAFQYEEACATVQGLRVSIPELETERTALLKKAEWLQSFMSTLAADLAATGYPQPTIKRNGVAIAGTANKITKTQIEIQTQYGRVEVPWQEVSPGSVLAMAEYFAARNTKPETTADRWWVAGVFAVQNGLQKHGLELLNRAALSKPQYSESLPLFNESPAKPATPE